MAGRYARRILEAAGVQLSGGSQKFHTLERLFMRHAPAAVSATAIKAAVTLLADAPVAVTTFAAQPDVPRGITFTPGGTTASIPGADILVEGRSATGQKISEAVPIAENASAAVSTAKLYSAISKVTLPEADGAGATITIGYDKRIAVPILEDAVYAPLSYFAFDGAEEEGDSEGVLELDDTDYAKSSYTPDGTPNGTKELIMVVAIVNPMVL